MTAFPQLVPEFAVRWLGSPVPAARRLYANAAGVAQAWNESIAASPSFEPHLEHLAIFTVGEGNTISGFRVLAKGSGNSVAAMAAELVLTAACTGALALFAAHNHPTNDLGPSEGDVEWTRRAAQVCEMAGVRLLDHIIVPSRPGPSAPLFASLRELGHFQKFDCDIASLVPVPQADRLEKVVLADPDVTIAMGRAAQHAGQPLPDFAQEIILELLRREFLAPRP